MSVSGKDELPLNHNCQQVCTRTFDAQGKRSGFGRLKYGAVACLWCRNFFRQPQCSLDPPKQEWKARLLHADIKVQEVQVRQVRGGGLEAESGGGR